MSRSPLRGQDRSAAVGYRATVRRLAGAQKPSKGAPAYSRFVNRPAGRSLAAAAYLLGRTPNEVTALSALFSGTGIVVLAVARPVWRTGVLVSLALVVGYALDAADGQLARLRGGGSPSGEWLDHVLDSAKIPALHCAVLISAYRFFALPDQRLLLVPIGFTVVSTVTFFGMILNDLLRQRVSAATGVAVQPGPPSTLRSILVLPTDYGVLCLLFVLLGSRVLFSAVYAVLFLANTAFLGLALSKWYRDMRCLPLAVDPGRREVTR